tara:strand:- start:6531 stop:7013 length:483 start_codon:yes stop_codon:yes gene_type:complete
MFSSKSDEWETPANFYEKLNRKFKFTLDPCCTKLNNRCAKYYTIEEDGLTKSWAKETVFVNPPYSDVGKWVKKAYTESTNNGAVVAMLIPSRTDTKYWHDYIMTSASAIYFIKGRLKFYNKIIADSTGKDDVNAAPFPSCVVVFGGLRWSPGPQVSTLER